MDRKAEAGQMLKANRGGAKDVGVTGQETYDAFALTGGGVWFSEHGSFDLAGGLVAVRFLPHFDVGGIVQDLAALAGGLDEGWSGAADAPIFERARGHPNPGRG